MFDIVCNICVFFEGFALTGGAGLDPNGYILGILRILRLEMIFQDDSMMIMHGLCPRSLGTISENVQNAILI